MTTYAETISDNIAKAVTSDKDAIVLGAGVTDGKGIFNTTRLAYEAKPEQVIETPLSETMLTGALVGLAQAGKKPIFVHARADFMTLSAEHLVNTIAKWKFMGGGDLPIMVRCIIGQGWGNGPQHTQSFAHWFASVPGLNVFTPATRGGINDAFKSWKDGNPTVVFEHRALYDTDYKAVDSGEVIGTAGVTILCTSGSIIAADKAAVLLRERGYWVNRRAIEHWHEQISIDGPCVLVDITPRYSLMASVLVKGDRYHIVSPPDYPCPASYPLEAQWYPSPERIANAALDVLGKPAYFDETTNEVTAPTGGPF